MVKAMCTVGYNANGRFLARDNNDKEVSYGFDCPEPILDKTGLPLAKGSQVKIRGEGKKDAQGQEIVKANTKTNAEGVPYGGFTAELDSDTVGVAIVSARKHASEMLVPDFEIDAK